MAATVPVQQVRQAARCVNVKATLRRKSTDPAREHGFDGNLHGTHGPEVTVAGMAGVGSPAVRERMLGALRDGGVHRRVELLVPVDDPDCRRKLMDTLKTYFQDTTNTWEMQSDGSYLKRTPRNEEEQTGSQQLMIERTRQRVREATRYQRGKGHRPVAGRNLR